MEENGFTLQNEIPLLIEPTGQDHQVLGAHFQVVVGQVEREELRVLEQLEPIHKVVRVDAEIGIERVGLGTRRHVEEVDEIGGYLLHVFFARVIQRLARCVCDEREDLVCFDVLRVPSTKKRRRRRG